MAFKYKRKIAGTELNSIKFKVGASQTIKIGDAVVLSSGLLVVAAASDTVILGVSGTEITTGAAPTANDTCEVYIDPAIIWTVGYAGTTKTSLAAADIGAAGFGLATKSTINLDDTTGPVVKVVAYDNTKKTADVVITSRVLV